MNCPVCKSAALAPTVETEPRMLECTFCGGKYLPFHEYWSWVSGLDSSQERPVDAAGIVDLPPSSPENQFAKLCPECGHIMKRIRVDLEMPFFIDKCGNCGGYWFDRPKWEVLKSRHLHTEIHQINTSTWQSKIKRAEIARADERLLRSKMGDEAYVEMIRVKTWLDAQPRRDLILAFLTHAKDGVFLKTA